MSDKITFLIVDDNEDTRKALGYLVGQEANGVEFNVVYASTLEEALQKTIEEQPHITFLDLRLPGRDIIEVIKAIPGMKPPVFAVSGLPIDFVLVETGRTVMAECLMHGAAGYLEKGTKGFFEAQASALQVVLKQYADSKYATSPNT